MVPNTDGLKGIEAAAAAGIAAGQADRILKVIASVTPEDKQAIRTYLENHEIRVLPTEGDIIFDIILTLRKQEGVSSCAYPNIIPILYM